MRIDVGKPHVDFRDFHRVRFRIGARHQLGPLDIGGKHDVDQAVLGARRFLRHLADAQAARNGDRARIGLQIAGNRAKERGLAGAVAPDKSRPRARRYRDRGVIEKRAPCNAQRDVVD